MTSREVVRRTLTFKGPERIALALPDPFPNDFRFAGPAPDPDHPGTGWEEVRSGRWERTDEWGNTWARIEGFSKGEVARGAVEDWDRLEEVEPPDYDLPERYEPAREAFAAAPDRFRVGFLPGFPFNVARKMRRLDNFLVDVLAEPERSERLLAVVEDQMHHAIRRLAEAGADGMMFPEDWGTQDRLLVRPEVWHRMFKPGFERLCRTAHERGVFVIMHSCGYIREAMEGMIEAGIDAFQFDQPELYGIEALADQFGGRATFWCPVDIQRTLQSGNERAIHAAAREMIERFGMEDGRFRGGFIAGHYGSNEAIGLDPRWQETACRAFVEFGAPNLWRRLAPRLSPAEHP
jgi:hypothetical protein